MVLTIDFRSSGDVLRWGLTDDGVTRTVHEEYTLTLFVGDAARDLYGRRGINRVRLPFENIESYDADWYEDAAIRAVESIVSCVGWDCADVTQHLADTTDTTLDSYLGDD